jgi:hypothetical protein
MRCWFLIVVAACGRIGFDVTAPVSGDGGALLGGDASPAAQPLPTCPGGTQHAPFGPASSITSAAIANGFAVAYVAADGSVRAATFSIAGTTISTLAADTEAFGPTQASVSIVGVPAGLLAEFATPAGTTFQELTPQLGSAAFPVGHAALTADPHALASSQMQVVWLDAASNELDVRYIADDGTVMDANMLATQSQAEEFTQGYLAVSNAGFVATWINTRVVPSQIEAARVPMSGLIGITPVMVPSTAGDASAVRTAWAASSNANLVTWIEAGAIRARLTDGQLAPITGAGTLGTGSDARIASDGTSFWLAWSDPSAPVSISAARVDATGVATVYTISGTATATAYDVVAVGSQAWLLVVDGSGLELIPLCAT